MRKKVVALFLSIMALMGVRSPLVWDIMYMMVLRWEINNMQVGSHQYLVMMSDSQSMSLIKNNLLVMVLIQQLQIFLNSGIFIVRSKNANFLSQ